MQADLFPAGGPGATSPSGLGLALALAAALAGCAVPAAAPAPAAPAPASTPMAQAMRPSEAPMPAPPAEAVAPPPAALATAGPTREQEAVLAYADRARSLPPAELATEIQRLGEGSYAPVPAMQLALALGHVRTGNNLVRAQSLLQRVQQDPQARSLHSLARLLASQLAEQRRLEEQAERQGQQLREAQRRIEQLNERLEAVRAIERSLPTRPRRDPPVAAPAPRPAP